MGVGLIRAEGAGPDRGIEVRSKVRVVLADARERPTYRPGDADPGALSRRRRDPVSTAQTYGRREFVAQGIDLGLSSHRTLRVMPSLRFRQIIAKVDQPGPVGGFRLRIQGRAHTPCTVRCRSGVHGACRFERGPVRPHELESVYLVSRGLEKVCQVAHPLGVSDAEQVPTVGDRPVVALTPERSRSNDRRGRWFGRGPG